MKKVYRSQNKRVRENAVVISAPLGDFRHMAHIGRDGVDFGEEHLFNNNSGNERKGNSGIKPLYATMNDSPIVKSSIPIVEAATMFKTDSRDSAQDSNTDSPGLTHRHQLSSNLQRTPKSMRLTSCDSLSTDTDPSVEFYKMNAVSTENLSSILGDVLAVMDQPQYKFLGNKHSVITTCTNASDSHISSPDLAESRSLDQNGVVLAFYRN